jgi:hypothetical protein
MKVKELIEALSKEDGELEVRAWYDTGVDDVYRHDRPEWMGEDHPKSGDYPYVQLEFQHYCGE